MEHEHLYHPRGTTFLTLTFRNADLGDNTIDREEARRYLKRLRKAVEPDKFRVYMCGEYGEKEGRAHYHAIVFGMHYLKDYPTMLDAWKKGFIYTGPFTTRRAQYVADYVQKTMLDETWEEINQGEKTRPFSIKSGGLGKLYCLDNAEKLRQSLSVNYKGTQVGLPRYYCKLLEIPSETLQQVAIEKDNLKWKEINRKTGIKRLTDRARLLEIDQGIQREVNFERMIHIADKGVL